jgi:hypothetical protein
VLELLDFDAPARVSTADELAAEVARLRDRVPRAPRLGEPSVERVVLPLDDWRARDCGSHPLDPGSTPAEDLSPVRLPHTTTAPFVHLRHELELGDGLGDRPVLHLEAVDYEASVYVDGRLEATHRGYFAPFEVSLDGLEPGRHQVDVIARRAEDRYQWSGESEALNFGDAHGKGLGSVVADAVTAGAGILGRTWVECRPPVRIDRWHFRGAPSGAVEVDVELDGPAGAVGVTVTAVLRDDSGTEVTRVSSEPTTAGFEEAVHLSASVAAPRAWSPADPHLYVLVLQVHLDGQLVDEVRRAVGLRSIERLDDGSLLLNELPLFLRGTTSIGCLWSAGWSGDTEAVIRQLLVVKALFGNTIRVHVHVLPELVYACADRVGVLIYQDAPLQWHCFEPRRTELDAELVQAAELAVHVRNHPSVVVLSLTNEMHMAVPFHDSDSEYVERSAALTRSLVGSVVLYQDWAGPTRPRCLPQAFHDYPGYFYHCTTADDSVLDWAGEGVRAVISEYGGGAIPSWKAIRDSQRAHVARGEDFPVPEAPSGRWTAEEGVLAPTGEMLDSHQRLVGWRGSFEEYRRSTGCAQARLLTYQTGRMRRDRHRVTGVIHHYLQNPAPYFYNPWVDLHVIDSAGEPTAGFDALREAFRVVGVDVLGVPARCYSGSTLNATVWCYNDLAVPVDVTLEWQWVDAAGAVLDKGHHSTTLAGAHSVAVASPSLQTPPGPADVALRVDVLVDGRPWTIRTERTSVHPPALPWGGAVAVLGDVDGLSERAGDWLHGLVGWEGPGTAAPAVVVTPATELDDAEREALRAFVAGGGRAVLLERPKLETLDWLSPKSPAVVAAGQVNETAAVDISMRWTGLTTDDLSRWATGDGRVVTDPLVTMDRRGTPVWARCGHRLQMAAIQEFTVGRGTFIVCQMHVWDALATEPMAARVLRHMLDAPFRPL